MGFPISFSAAACLGNSHSNVSFDEFRMKKVRALVRRRVLVLRIFGRFHKSNSVGTEMFTKLFPASCKKAILLGQTAGSCPNNAFFKMVKEAAPEIEWAEDAFALGCNDITEDYVILAAKTFDADVPQASNGNDKYFVQGMEGAYYDQAKKVFDLGPKRWVVANSIGANNVDFGLGMVSAFEQRRNWILNEVLFLADNTIFGVFYSWNGL